MGVTHDRIERRLMQLKKAERTGLYSRIALDGPPGSGKTWSALAIATGLKGNKKILVLDTEHGTAKKYAEDFEFYEGDPLPDFSPDNYTSFIETAGRNSEVGVLIIDSLSHAWSGKGGALEQVDKIAKRSNSGNTFAAWRDVTPMHNRLVEAMLASPFHLIVTMRTKTEYVLEKNETTGKLQPRKLGMAPIQRDGIEYEMDLVGDMNLEHDLVVSKTRYKFLDGMVINRPTKQLGEDIAKWLSGAAAVPVMATNTQIRELVELGRKHDKTPDEIAALSRKMFGRSPREVTTEQMELLKYQLTMAA